MSGFDSWCKHNPWTLTLTLYSGPGISKYRTDIGKISEKRVAETQQGKEGDGIRRGGGGGGGGVGVGVDFIINNVDPF